MSAELDAAARELEAWRADSAGELRTYAELLRAKAERALEVADMLEPNHRKRRRKRRTGQVADGRGGFVGEQEPEPAPAE